MTPTEPVYGLVLSGGQSRRMGRDKALLEYAGETQLARAVRLLEKHVERVFVSVRQDQADDPERRRFEQVVDRYTEIGPAAGILSALEAHPDVAWLVLACDLPNANDDVIATLLRSRSAQPFTAFRSSGDGLPEPLCAVFRPQARALIAGFVADGIVCPRKMMLRSDTCLLELPDPAALDNVNTPDDLARVTAAS